MTFAKVLLGLNGLMFLGYGVACLIYPSLPAGYAGMELPNASAANEVVAMYGGLQFGIGVLFLRAAMRPTLISSGLLAMALLLGSLATARAFGLLVHGSSPYNLGAFFYESISAVLAVVAWQRLRAEDTATGEPA
jgi:hypothetical protein